MRLITYRIGYQDENQILIQLRFIYNSVIMDIQWMVHWWVLVHCGWPSDPTLQYIPTDAWGSSLL
jgi:hypothetical protein